jgi:hypothetical protein
MCLRRFIEPEALRDLWLDDALPPQIQELGRPTAQALDLTPHMSEIDAKHALIGVMSASGLNCSHGVPASTLAMPRMLRSLPLAAAEIPNIPSRPVGARMR